MPKKKQNFRNSPDSLEQLDGNERARLYKKARQQRRATQAPRPRERRRSYDEWLEASDEECPSVQKMTRAGGTLDDLVEKLLDQPEPTPAPDAGAEHESDGAQTTWTGVVTHVTAGRCQVLDASGNTRRCRTPEWLQDSTPVAVGDEVHVITQEQCDEDEVGHVLPRRTILARPDAMVPGRQRVIVANVDVVAIVASVKTPPLRPRLIDRYLVAIEQGGATPLVVVNKVDLVSADEREATLAALHPLRALGVEWIECSALQHHGLDRLREELRDKTVAFVGHSGVGKSSVVNALAPDLAVDTGAVTDHSGKGTHTTTSSSLYEIGNGTRLIDTPGIRSFGLQGLTPDELRDYFHEFDAVAGQCRFADCTHDHEPECQVQKAVAAGEISDARYETYVRLLREL